MDVQDFSRPPPLPSYPEMIYAAIDALNENNGSNKTSISNCIESQYPNLPADRATLLRHHLIRMRDSGELIFWKNNYMKPNPNFIRRGRGRPPKPKGPGVPTSPYRHRSRPNNDDSNFADPNAARAPLSFSSTSTAGVGSRRPRGRPRKTPCPAADESTNLCFTGIGLVGPGLGTGVGSHRSRGMPREAQPKTTSGFV